MPTRKPVPAILPWLTALAAAPFVLVVAAVTATRFGGLDLAIGYDLLTWTVARFLAWVGLAAALAHHNRNHDERDARHDDDYSRGYQDALYGATYDRNDSESYHDGYLAGEAERSNRRASNTDHVRRAPWAAQQACSARADDFQNRPRGSSAPISVRDLGGGDWRMVMGTGPYRSVCVVSNDGRVRSIDPY